MNFTQSDNDPLQVALAAQKPIDDAPRQPLAVELLLTESQRVTVQDHQAFRDSIKPEPQEAFDEIDSEVDSLTLERPAQRRSNRETNRVLSILDELERKGREA